MKERFLVTIDWSLIGKLANRHHDHRLTLIDLLVSKQRFLPIGQARTIASAQIKCKNAVRGEIAHKDLLKCT